MNLYELTRNLIEIQSFTGEETGIMEFLSQYLEELGFSIHLQPVADKRYNILATAGTPRVVLSTHTDTVQPYLPYSEDDSYIYGRGACDTKGIIAAQLKAAETLLNNGQRDFGLLFVIAEEGESEGAIAANTLPNTCQWLINGEPTQNKMAVGSKGALRVKLDVAGKACHSAYPHLGDSAIEKLLDILADVRQAEWPVHDTLGPTTCNIGLISGGIQPNVVAPHASAHLMFRVVTSTHQIKTQLTRLVGTRGQLDFYFGYEPVLTHVLEGFETVVAAYGTDIPFLTNWGTPLLFGPGSIMDAHSPGEKISKQQLEEAVHHYTGIISRLLAQGSPSEEK